MNAIQIIKNGIVKENPTFVLMLGMCPTLATTTSALNGMSMGLATMAVLICTNFVISCLKSVTPDKVRIPVFIVVIAAFVTILQLVIKAFLPDIDAALGLFIPLIVVNCVILGRAEAFAAKQSPVASLFDGIGIGLGFTLGLTLLGICREILGSGSIFGLTLLPETYNILLFVLPPGAFITLGFLIAIVNKLRSSVMDYILIFISAIFVNNIVLSQFLGICPFLGVSKKIDTSLGMSAAVAFVLTLATIVTYLVQKFVLDPNGLQYLQTIAFILVIASLVQMVEIVLKKVSPALYQALGIFLPLITTNCAVLGVAILVIQKDYSLLESVVYAFSTAIGFGLALTVFAGMREQLELVKIPKGMQGMAIVMLSAGLLSLAFMGFSGVDGGLKVLFGLD